MQFNPPTHSAEALIYTDAPSSQLGATQPTINIDSVSSVLLAQQLPPLSKFSGEVNDGDLGVSMFEEWLERFELMATALSWSSQAKLVSLITRLHGQAYSFFGLVQWSSILVIAYWLLSYVSDSHL